MAFALTPKQHIANTMMGGDAVHTLLYGGSRSAKSFTICRRIFARALQIKEPSRHLMVRFRLVHIKASLVVDTIPKMLELCFPEVYEDLKPGGQSEHRKGDGYYKLRTGAEIWYAGIDDKERAEKILGQEYASIFFNECSQIPWNSYNLLMTRLAQKTPLKLRAFYDENPPLRTHWSHRLFIEKVKPDTLHRLPDPENYQHLKMNPIDNLQNVAPGYMTILDAMPERARKRFRDGEFGDAGESALWTIELLEQQRVENDIDLPDLLRIVVGVDPSGASSPDDAARDEIGIVVAGLGTDGVAYVLEDLTMKGSPAEWGHIVINAYDRWQADRVVAEENFGGAVVKAVVMGAAANYRSDGIYAPTRDHPVLKPVTPVNVNYSSVTATRGKVVRAEPISGLYEQGKVKHVAGLGKLEDEMIEFTAFGYVGDRSPNRADAAVWALSALFPTVIRQAKAMGDVGRGPPRVNLGHANLKRRMMGRR